MKKILIILGTLSMGGGQHMVYELVDNIDKSRFDVTVMCYIGKLGTPLEKKVEEVANIVYLNENHGITLASMKHVFAKIREINPDLIHAHLGGMVYAIPWAFLNKKKSLMITAHTEPSQAFHKKVEKLFHWLLKNRKKTTMVVAVSKENHTALMNYFSIDCEVCRYINNGIQLKKFYRTEHDYYTFINVARQDENKNQIAILECFNELYINNKNIRLLLVGDGPCHSMLVERTKVLGIESAVSFPGMVKDVENYYAVSDAYIQSSFVEAMPLSALEAMAAGLPLISTDVGGMKDITCENGLLIPPGNNEALVTAMDTLLYEQEEQRKIREQKSLELVENYSSEKMAKEYMKLYDEMLGVI